MYLFLALILLVGNASAGEIIGKYLTNNSVAERHIQDSSVSPSKLLQTSTYTIGGLITPGFIGIGITNPLYQLDIIGNARINNDLTLYGSLINNVADLSTGDGDWASQFGFYGVSGIGALVDTSLLATTDKIFKFPNLSGTFSLLQATQTFTGINIFTSTVTQIGSGFDASATALLTISGANKVLPSQIGNFAVYSNDAVAADRGGSFVFGGVWNDTGNLQTQWAGVAGKKDNGTSGQYGGYLTFYSRPHGLGLQERLRITSSGNVGIGLTNPSEKLEVLNGNIKTNYGVNASTFVGNGSSLTGIGVLASTQTWTGQNTFNNQIIISSAALISGNVGIGITAPVSTLHVNGNGIFVSTVEVQGNAFSVGGSTLIVINGNVGIGITPLYPLHVNGIAKLENVTGTDLQVDGSAQFGSASVSNPNPSLNFTDTSPGDDDWRFLKAAGDAFYLQQFVNDTTWTDRIMISSEGFVGIGTSTPNVPLMVIGSATITEMVTASSFNIVGSAYLVNGVRVIDGSRNLYATSLRISTVADCGSQKPDSYGQICTEVDPLHPLWVATSTVLGGFSAVELHETEDSEGYGSLYIASATAVATTISVSSTPYTINGTYVAGANLHNFTVSGSSFVYTGSGTHLFKVSINASIRIVKDLMIGISFEKNGTALAIPHMVSTGSKDNFDFGISNEAVVSLTTNDTISFSVCNLTSTASPTVYLNANIIQID